MSRIGNAPVALPQGVEVKFNNGEVSVKGKLGELKQEISTGIHEIAGLAKPRIFLIQSQYKNADRQISDFRVDAGRQKVQKCRPSDNTKMQTKSKFKISGFRVDAYIIVPFPMNRFHSQCNSPFITSITRFTN